MKSRVIVILAICFILIGGTLGTVQYLKAHKTIAGKQLIKVSGIIALKTQQELIQDSDLIIVGMVDGSMPSKWSNPNFIKGPNTTNTLTTDIRIKILKVLRGEPYDNKEIAARIDKGKTEDTIVESDGYPDFPNGEKVLLFLSKEDPEFADLTTNYYILTGMIQGKYKLKSGEDFYENEMNKKTIDLKAFIKDIQTTPAKDYEAIKKRQEEIRINNEKVLGR